eukprot:jgi/Mesvir1/18189/Mv26546-RA.1
MINQLSGRHIPCGPYITITAVCSAWRSPLTDRRLTWGRPARAQHRLELGTFRDQLEADMGDLGVFVIWNLNMRVNWLGIKLWRPTSPLR